MNVISFCLYGTAEHYQVGAVRNAELCKTIYPGWDVWFYVSPSISEYIINKLLDLDARVIIVEAPDNAFFMNYRYLPCTDTDYTVERAIFRDTDSRVDEREAAAVAEWIKSDKGLHIMRDHPYHPPHPTQHMLLGGMWGVKCDKLKDFDTLAIKCVNDTEHGADQRLLTKYVYPRFSESNDICVHDEFFDKKPFPVPRKWIEVNKELLPLFVGCQFGSDDKPTTMDHLRILRNNLNANI
jgi:hypothetical protein